MLLKNSGEDRMTEIEISNSNNRKKGKKLFQLLHFIN